MRILDLYIGRFINNSASKTFTTLVILLGGFFNFVGRYIEQGCQYYIDKIPRL